MNRYAAIALSAAAITAACRRKPADDPAAVASPATSSDASAPGSEPPPPPPPLPTHPTLRGLAIVARECGDIPRAPRLALRHCDPWKELIKRVRPHVEVVDIRNSQTVLEAIKRVEPVLPRLAAPTAIERAAARQILEMSLPKFAGHPRARKMRDALIERYREATEGDERRELLRLVGNHPDERVEGLLLDAVEKGNVDLRWTAYTGLVECLEVEQCRVEPAQVRAWYDRETSERVKDAVRRLAGRLSMDEVVTWCPDTDEISPGCRRALAALASEPAFTLLGNDFERALERSDLSKSWRGIGDRVTTIIQFLPRDFARKRVIELLDAVLVAGTKPNPKLLTLVMMEMKPVFGDRSVQALVVGHFLRVDKEKWNASPFPAEQSIWNRLRSAVVMMDVGPTIGLPSRPDAPDPDLVESGQWSFNRQVEAAARAETMKALEMVKIEARRANDRKKRDELQRKLQEGEGTTKAADEKGDATTQAP